MKHEIKLFIAFTVSCIGLNYHTVNDMKVTAIFLIVIGLLFISLKGLD